MNAPAIVGITAVLSGVAMLVVVSRDRPGIPGSAAATSSSCGLHAAPMVTDRRAAIAVADDATPSRSREVQVRGVGRVDLQVLDDAHATPLSGFSWSLSTAAMDGVPASGQTAAAQVRLTVPLNAAASVRVAAEGYADSLPIDVSLRDGVPYRAVEVRLLPAASPNVVLAVRDENGQPVSHLRISCAVGPDPEGGANSYRALWTRPSASPDGRHTIDGLERGRYRLRLVALNADGRPRMLLPQDCIVRVDRPRVAEAQVVMEPAGTILLTPAADLATASRPLIVRLEGPGTQSRRHRWLALDRPTEPTLDTLPAMVDCELYEPVPAGEYTLQVSGAADLRRKVTVSAGRVSTVSIR